MRMRTLKWVDNKADGRCANYVVKQDGDRWHCAVIHKGQTEAEVWTTSDVFARSMAAILDQYLWNEKIAEILG